MLMNSEHYHGVLRTPTHHQPGMFSRDTAQSPKWLEFMGWYIAALLLLLLIVAVDGWTRQRDMRNHIEQELHDCVRGWE